MPRVISATENEKRFLAAFNREKSARLWEGEGEPVTNQLLYQRGERKKGKKFIIGSP